MKTHRFSSVRPLMLSVLRVGATAEFEWGIGEAVTKVMDVAAKDFASDGFARTIRRGK